VTISYVLRPTADEWVQRVDVTAVGISTPFCDMDAILPTPGNLNNTDPGAELPTAHHKLIPVYASLSRHLHTAGEGTALSSRFRVVQDSTLSKRESA
jgi:hypothetical protein